MVKAITILFVLMTTTFVQAQIFELRVTGKKCDQYSCSQIVGTGTACYLGDIGNRSVFVTAAHNFEGMERSYISDGTKYVPAVLRHHVYQQVEVKNNKVVKPLIDYAIIDCEKIKYKSCFTLAEEQPKNGTPATAHGQDGINDRYVSQSSVISSNENGYFFMKPVMRGQSGGPIVANDKLVGVIHGYMGDGPHETRYTPSNTIKTGLFRIYGRYPRCNCRPVPRKVVVVNPVKIEPKPQPIVIDNSEQIKVLEVEIAKLNAKVDKLAKTQIPVQIIGSDDKVVSEEKYLLGKPIKLRFKFVEKETITESNAKGKAE